MSEMRLAGRTALVTGAGKRLGKATALALAEAGADVVLHFFLSAADAETVAAEIEGKGRRAWTVGADLSDPEAAGLFFSRAAAAAGKPIDILINCASIFPRGRLMTFTQADLATNLQVNALSPLALCRAMAAQKVAGDIVNFLDTRILDYDRAHVPYHISKQMLFSLTRMLALELAPAVKVNAVAPGLILPPDGKDEEYLLRQHETNPLSRHGAPRDVTDTVMLLITNSFITGQVVFVDGGRHMKAGAYGM